MVSIPTYDQLISPLLNVLATHAEGMKTRDVYEAIANAVGLGDDDKRKLLPSRQQPVYQNRIGWAHDRLKRAELSRSIARGTWQLTEEGRAFAAKHAGGIDDKTLRSLVQVPAGSTATHRASTSPSIDALSSGGDPPPDDASISIDTQSPDERIDAASRDLNESLSRDILDAVAGVTPIRFESLVLDVLHAMGYGAQRSDLEETVASGDGGIDGIITLDRLGLEKVYVQAKRWTSNTVGRPEIQKFVGALAGQGGTRGVFITTSVFSSEARHYAKNVPNSLVLIDGKELAALMIEYGVGVSVQRVVKIARLDTDYFED